MKIGEEEKTKVVERTFVGKMINGQHFNELVELVKKRPKNMPLPNVEDFKRELDPDGHKVNSSILRPDKDIKVEKEVYNTITKKHEITTEDAKQKVNRVAIALQKLIVKRSVAFLFGNEPKTTGDIETDAEKELLDIVSKIKKSNKIYSANRRAARAVFSYTEAAEYWFLEKVDPHTKYNKTPTPFKLRHILYSPGEGYTLYPVFSASGDLIVFGVEFNRTNSKGEEDTYFDLLTADFTYKFVRKHLSTDWELEKAIVNSIGKIPIVYARQNEVEWNDVQNLIERLETLLSNFAETNDYHASPKIFIQGKLIGFAKKGDAGAILEGEKGTSASYLSWDHAPESVKLEIETLLSNIYTLTQTPNISFDSVKGLGALSGIALKLLFLDAHLKVKDKEEIFGEFLQRRNSIIQSFTGMMYTKLAKEANSLNLEDTIIPYMIDDVKNEVETLLLANGNNPIMSHEESIRRFATTADPDVEMERIKKELQEKSRVNFDLFEQHV